jgi:GNAT superfamily N-acetyltransferase
MYMCRSGVAEDARGQGLQRRLLRVREAFARKNGARWLISDTTDNTISANNLIAVGFRLFNPSVPWGLKHALYWCKRIAE